MRHILLTILVFFIFIKSNAQVDNEFKDSFLEAQSYFLFEEYEEALPIYSKLLRSYPYNNNLRYLIGRCLLHDPYRTNQAIKYLEEAVKHMDPKYKLDSYKEIMAPFDALFYLGEAYHKNDMLEKAIDQYEKFLMILNENEYDKDLVLKRIESCKYAIESFKSPVTFNPVNLGNNINSGFEEFNAVISGDGKTLAFTRKLQFYDAIFVCYLTDTGWSAPENIITHLGVDGNVFTSSLNYKGNILYLYNIDDYDGNIYISIKKDDNTWSKIIKLNNNINTKYWESNAFESSDGSVLYFSSNRPGGYGRLDIYMSYRSTGLEWGPAVNLGSDINTVYNEDAPVLIHKGNILIFSSYGHTTIGDYDYFISYKENDIWSVPKNLGYPFNTTGEEIVFSVTEDAKEGILTLYREETFGLKDIYKIDLELDLPDLSKVEKNDREIISEGSIEKQKRDTFSISLKDIIAKTEKTENTQSTSETKADSIITSGQIKDNTGQNIDRPVLYIENKEYDVQEGTELSIPLILEKNTKLTVKIIHNDELTFNQKYNIKDSIFVFRHSPAEGTNIIKFIVTDDAGNIATETVKVISTVTPVGDDKISTVLAETNIGVHNVKEIIDRLIQHTGDLALKEILDSIKSHEIEGLTRYISGIFDYILNHEYINKTDSSRFITELLNSIFKTTGLDKININEFYNILLQNCTPKIREFITGIRINEEEYTPVTLFEYIFKSEPYESYTIDDIYQTLSNILLKYGSEENTYLAIKSEKGKRNITLFYVSLALIFILIFIYIIKRKKDKKMNHLE